MKIPDSIKRDRTLILVIILTTAITLALAYSTYFINFWPTDSYRPYIPTASKLWDLAYFSQMHDLPVNSLSRLNMHGKEALIVGIAIMQKVLNDTQTLYPNVLLLILCVQVSAIALYLIMKRFFDARTGFIAFILFAFCFWPYLYTLQGAHQPLVLMFFLLTLLFLQKCITRKVFSVIAGMCFGFMVFSSPTSPIYMPYFLLLFLLREVREFFNKNNAKNIAQTGLLFIVGGCVVGLLFTMPNPVRSLNDFINFVFHSQHGNHFDHYREILLPVLPKSHIFHMTDQSTFRGAGWIWIVKYVFLIMPVLIVVYAGSLIYLFLRSFARRSLFFVILISLSTPLLVEIAQVSQFGRNYFSWLIGMIFAVSFAVFLYTRSKPKRAKITITVMCVLHIAFNLYIFLGDVLPSRLGTAKIDHWLRKNDVKELLVFQGHPRNTFTTMVLNNPKHKSRIKFYGIDHIRQPQDGYILVPPSTGKTIWNDCAGEDFDRDPALNELILSDQLSKYAVASFPTIASSKIWNQEEEVCTYRDLILGQVSKSEREDMRVYILDVKKLRE